jgi:hypothetical protein
MLKEYHLKKEIKGRRETNKIDRERNEHRKVIISGREKGN